MKLSPWWKTQWSSTATARKKSSDAIASSIRLEATSHQPDLPAGVFQPLLDEIFVSPLCRGAFRLRTSGNRATCHDGSPLPGRSVPTSYYRRNCRAVDSLFGNKWEENWASTAKEGGSGRENPHEELAHDSK